jgi:hypothetical protein
MLEKIYGLQTVAYDEETALEGGLGEGLRYQLGIGWVVLD